jgi:hypothetical protein
MGLLYCRSFAPARPKTTLRPRSELRTHDFAEQSRCTEWQTTGLTNVVGNH